MDDTTTTGGWLRDERSVPTAIPYLVGKIVVTEFTDQDLTGICISLKDGRMIGTICGTDDWPAKLAELLDEVAHIELGEAD